jgi:hypothetical protein
MKRVLMGLKVRSQYGGVKADETRFRKTSEAGGFDPTAAVSALAGLEAAMRLVDDVEAAFAANQLVIRTNLFDACTYFHVISSRID